MGGRLPECLANLFIVNGSAWPVVEWLRLSVQKNDCDSGDNA